MLAMFTHGPLQAVLQWTAQYKENVSFLFEKVKFFFFFSFFGTAEGTSWQNCD